jgi:hypothetical protein
MTGLEWVQSWWYKDVPKLIQETDVMYARLVAKGQSDKLTATKKKIYAERGWEPSKFLIEKNFDAALKELNFFYVPKGWLPGPCFVFPQVDITGAFTRAQTRPLYKVEWESEEGSTSKSKYCVAGCRKDLFKGPIWLGNQPHILQRIVELGWCIVVEGPFDLLACRLLAPNVPVLCSMTKTINDRHEAYLKMLGVKTLYFMFDNERPKKEGQTEGAGNASMHRLQHFIKWCNVEPIFTVGEDASECLKVPARARMLRSQLLGVS